MAKKQPGCMLYFDLRPSLKRLSLEEKGRLLEAILDFGECGTIPELDGALAIAWDFIQPRLESDRDRYEEICKRRRDAANTRWERPQQGDANECKSMQVMPTTTQLNTTTTSPSTATTTSSGARNLDFEFNERKRARIASLDGWKGEQGITT